MSTTGKSSTTAHLKKKKRLKRKKLFKVNKKSSKGGDDTNKNKKEYHHSQNYTKRRKILFYKKQPSFSPIYHSRIKNISKSLLSKHFGKNDSGYRMSPGSINTISQILGNYLGSLLKLASYESRESGKKTTTSKNVLNVVHMVRDSKGPTWYD